MKQYSFKGFFLLLIILGLFVQETTASVDVEKKKKIEKSFNVGKNTLIEVDNRYGLVHVDTWNKNKVELLVEIIVRKRNERNAQEILDMITVDIGESSERLSFETKIDGNINNSRSETIEINYHLKVPEKNPLEIENRYGDVFIADLKGNLKLDLSYGHLKAENLTGEENDIDLAYGNGEIRGMSKGRLETSYFSASIGSLGNVEIDNAYGSLTVEKGGDLEVDTRYGDLEIEEVHSVAGEVAYADLEIERLTGGINIEARYSGGIEIEEISSSVREVSIDAKYSSIDLRYAPDIDADVEVYTRHAKLSYNDENADFYYVNEGEHSRSEYKGIINKGKKTKFYILSSYGDVRLKKSRMYTN